MNQKFTQEDLIRYAYQETNAAETKSIEAALKTDTRMQMALQNIHNTFEALDKEPVGPSKSSVDIIMGYAQEQHPELQ